MVRDCRLGRCNERIEVADSIALLIVDLGTLSHLIRVHKMSRTVSPQAIGDGCFPLPLRGAFTLKCNERLSDDDEQKQDSENPNGHGVNHYTGG